MDQNDANVFFGSANIAKLTKFKMDGGEVDFGDDPHLFGAPQGTAIIVWSIDGRVAVKGRLFSDNFRDPQTASMEILFTRRDGHTPNPTKRSQPSQGGIVASKLVSKVSPVGRYVRVKITLKQTIDAGLGPVTTTLKTRTFNRS